jgi:hypothetical protein
MDLAAIQHYVLGLAVVVVVVLLCAGVEIFEILAWIAGGFMKLLIFAMAATTRLLNLATAQMRKRRRSHDLKD